MGLSLINRYHANHAKAGLSKPAKNWGQLDLICLHLVWDCMELCVICYLFRCILSTPISFWKIRNAFASCLFSKTLSTERADSLNADLYHSECDQ